jgi:hypothetical protein
MVSAMSEFETEVFDAKTLTQVTPFTVMWENTSTVKKTSKAGGVYEKKVVVVSNPQLTQPISVEVTRQQYERLRVLNLMGIKRFSATEGVADTKGYRNIILTGAAVLHEGEVSK